MHFLLFALLSLPALAQSPADWRRLDAVFDRMYQDLGTGFAVELHRAGAPIYAKAYGNFTRDRQIPIASASKWLSGAVVLRAVDAGELTLDDTIGQYLPYFTGPSRTATIRQAFSHTAGFGPRDAACVMDRNTTLDECAREIATLDLLAPPGSIFVYGGSSMQAVGRVVEVATGRTWASLFNEMTALLGMRQTQAAAPRRDGNPMIGGGASSTAADYLRFLDMMQAGGVWQGRRVLSRAALLAILGDQTNQARIVFSPYMRVPELGEVRYGIGNWREVVVEGKLQVSSSTGAFGFTPWIDWRHGVTGVIAILNDNPKVVPYYVEARQILDEILP
jgi:serine-type D-Ala-D-Ala carboxypeptidase/endopeptidase